MRSKYLAYIFIFCSFSSLAQAADTTGLSVKAEGMLRQMTVPEKLSYIGGVDWMYTKDIARLGIPRLRMTDGPQGLGTHGKSTAYPATIMLAATWNEDLAYEYGSALGRDCRARGVNVLLGPAVNIYRAAMCGRNFEYMGEDPYLASRVAVGYIRGVQKQGVIATIKHFAANNSEYDRNNISNDIDERTLHEIYFPAFKAVVQEANVGAVMTSYNLLNGIYTSENSWLLKNVLREQWGFKGMVMSDWGAVHYTVPAAKSGLDLEMPGGEKMNPRDMAYYLKTGDISMEMIDGKVRNILRTVFSIDLKDAGRKDKTIPYDDPSSVQTALNVAREGIVLLKNEKKILPVDPKKIRNIVITGKNACRNVYGGGSGAVIPFRFTSIFDGIKEEALLNRVNVEYADELDFLPKIVFTDENHTKAGFHAEYFNNPDLKGKPVFEQAEKKISYSWTGGTGLKDVPKDGFSVRWTGVLRSDDTYEYNFTLGGDDGYRLYIDDVAVISDWANGGYRSTSAARILQKGVDYKIRIEYYQGGGGASVNFIWNRANDKTDQYRDYLNKADLVIACFGHNSDTEGEGSDRSFELPEADKKMLGRVLKVNKPVIGIVNAGGNIGMQDWQPQVSGLLWSWYAGQEGGKAIAEVLFGKVNPSGKLPVSFEKKWEDNPAYNSYYDPDGDKHVKYTEGLLIGYRGYDKLKRDVQYPFGYGLSYTTFKISNPVISGPNDKGAITINFRLSNQGKRAGAEVVQVYTGPVNSPADRPEKELRKFKKIFLKAGGSELVTLEVSKEAFTVYDVKAHAFVKEEGKYRIMLGFSSRNIKWQKDIDISCK